MCGIKDCVSSEFQRLRTVIDTTEKRLGQANVKDGGGKVRKVLRTPASKTAPTNGNEESVASMRQQIQDLRLQVNILESQNKELQQQLSELSKEYDGAMRMHLAALSAARITPKSVEELEKVLVKHHIALEGFGVGSAKHTHELQHEIEVHDCSLQLVESTLERVVEPVVVRIYYGPHILVNTEQQLEDGRVRPRNQLLVEKKHPEESWESAAIRGIKEELHIDLNVHPVMALLRKDYEFLEETRNSPSYPGLVCRYRLHYVPCQVLCKEGDTNPILSTIGLEGGIPGTFNTREPSRTGEKVHFWVWKHVKIAAREKIKGLPEHDLRRQENRASRQPPTRTASVMFTDVEGSTELWEAMPETMGQAIEAHDTLMRQLLHVHYGYEITTEGDAFMMAFHEPEDAVAFGLDLHRRLMKVDWPKGLLSAPKAAPVMDSMGNLLFKGLRVRCGIATGAVKMFQDDMTKRVMYTGEAYDRAAAVSELPNGGQVFIDGDTYDSIAGALTSCRGNPGPDEEAANPIVVDEGVYKMGDAAVPVFQVVSAHLAARTVKLRAVGNGDEPLATTAYWHAPGATSSYRLWKSDPSMPPCPPVVIVFICAFKFKKVDEAVGKTKSSVCLNRFCKCVRSCLVRFNGYLCQEDHGCFMTVFGRAEDAILMCIELNICLMKEDWGPEVLACPETQEVVEQDCVIWRGLRAKCGMYEGTPTSIEPHKTTGRADYFGPLVNRAARFMGAAGGGQIVAEKSLLKRVHKPEYDWKWKENGLHIFKGVSDPFDVCTVMGNHPAFHLRQFPDKLSSAKARPYDPAVDGKGTETAEKAPETGYGVNVALEDALDDA